MTLIFILLCSHVCSQPSSIGLFDTNTDVGTNVKKGSCTFIPSTNQYMISGAGSNVWADQDEFQFVWKKDERRFYSSYKS